MNRNRLRPLGKGGLNQVNKILRTRIKFFGFHSKRDYFLQTNTNNPESNYPD